MATTRRGKMTTAVDATIRELTLTKADDAAVALARRYAADLDAGAEGAELAKVGAALLAALTALGATPAARAKLTTTPPVDSRPPSKLAALRARRAS